MNNMPASLPDPTSAEIRTELSKLLNSPEFSSSIRFRRFLSFIVEETLAGRGDDLKAYTIAIEAFDRDPKFDPQSDAVVRVEATRLRGRLDTHYMANPPLEGGIKITLPKGGYKPAFHRIGASNAKSDSSTAAHSPPPSRLKTVIAVLPFANLGGGEKNSHLARGLSEEITMGLVHFDDFIVISAPDRSPDQAADPPWGVGKALGARFLLSGSTQIISNIIRFRVSLVDTETGSNLWAEKFDREFTEENLLNIVDEVSTRVVMCVGDGFGFINRFLAREKAGKSVAELEIYEAILRYHHWVATLSPDRGREAIPALERAIALDPGYALPCAMLSDLYAGYYQWGQETAPDFLDKSEDLAGRALDLDPGCQHAQWARAYNFYLRGDGDQFLEVVHRAVDINPYNFNIISTSGIKICMLGDWEQGLELIRRGKHLSLDMPGWIYVAEVLYHYLNRNFSEALSKAKLIAAPDFSGGPLLRAAVYGQMGLYEQGHAELNSLLDILPRFSRDCRELLRRIFFQPAHIDSLLQGLRSSGFTQA